MISDAHYPIKRALLSVSDKTGVVELAKQLTQFGIELISTGGTRKLLEDEGLNVLDISQFTGFDEILDGRVKTLHPKVHSGLLARRDDAVHQVTMAKFGMSEIDLLVVNLYPFVQTVQSGADYDTVIENIDIGGPAMIRAGAKNHDHVTVVVDPADYEYLVEQLHSDHGTDATFRQNLAAKAFARIAVYDSMVSSWFADQLDNYVPDYRGFGGKLAGQMRYGENPHQWAGFYLTDEQRHGVATAKQLQGKKLSYNNINDTDAAFELVSEFDPQEKAAVAIIKHANPCGAAVASTPAEAYKLAFQCDPLSAFGGIVAANQTIDEALATELAKIFAEVIIAPEFSTKALDILAAKKNLRLLRTGGLADPKAQGALVKSVAGGLLVQARDNAQIDALELKTVTERAPTEPELNDLKMAFTVAKHVKSNAIVYVKDNATVGIGAGQMSRLDSTRIATRKALDAAKAMGQAEALTKGSVAASDAFFPFADGLEVIIEAGATAVIQPGGSMRDQEVIDAANKAGIAMVFSGTRTFRH